MQAVHLIEVCLAAVGGAVIGAWAYRQHACQQIGLLKQRLARSEEARNGALERSVAARDQIAQLSKSISELRRTHQPARAAAAGTSANTLSAEERRAAAERALAQASNGQRDRAPEGEDGAPVVFAQTQPMTY